MRRQRLALLGAAAFLSVALLAAAADSPAARASAPAAVGGGLDAADVAKPKPTVKSVSISLNAGRAATQTIGPQGGSITAKAADGTTYTLVLPKDALVGATEVKVIPVKSVGGLGGHAHVVGGVQLKPEGLGLFKPATLTITPSSLNSKPTQAFSWYGAGRTLGRYPSTRTGSRLKLQLTHFSGDGVAQGESIDWSNWQSVADAMEAHYQQSVRPLMTRAETDESAAFRAMQDYLGWERQLQLLGFDDFMTQEREGLKQSIEKVLRNFYEKASERCVKQHKLAEATTLVAGAREAALLGYEQLSNELLAKAKKCSQFELDYETVITVVAAPFGPIGVEVKRESRVRVLGLQLDLFTNDQVSGEKQIEYLSWNYTGTRTFGDSTCSYAPAGTQLGAPFRVTRLSGMLPKLKEMAGPDGRPQFDPPSISLSVYPGKPAEITSVDCTDTPRQVFPPLPYYWGAFTVLYSQQAEGDSFRIDGWDFLGGSVYARKTYERTRVTTAGPPQTVTERTTYVLRHTPK